jgi:hypothetical protein
MPISACADQANPHNHAVLAQGDNRSYSNTVSCGPGCCQRCPDALLYAGRYGGGGPAVPCPPGSPLHDALNAVAAAAYAAIARHGLGQADWWPLPGGFDPAPHVARFG